MRLTLLWEGPAGQGGGTMSAVGAHQSIFAQFMSIGMQVLLASEHLFAACDSVSLVKSLGRAAEDSKSRPAALDSLAKLHHIMGPKFQVLLPISKKQRVQAGSLHDSIASAHTCKASTKMEAIPHPAW